MDNTQEQLTFYIYDETGKEIKCEALFTFESVETHKEYIVYTDNTKAEDGTTKIYAAIFNQDDGNVKLSPIETEKEWQIIEAAIKELEQEAKGDI